MGVNIQPGRVAAKKYLGQHFLTDLNIAKKIADSLSDNMHSKTVMEVGPGMGVLTKFLKEKPFQLLLSEIDSESVVYLKSHFPELADNILQGDFLTQDLSVLGSDGAVIGNFPYNISSQILFHCLEYRANVKEVVGMFQKEVAERIASIHGNKVYGILSVLIQTYYTTEYLFTVSEHVFHPPPKVKSGVIRLVRREDVSLQVSEKFFFMVVKMSFGQRRKTLRNSLKPLLKGTVPDHPFMEKRAEQLSIAQFAELAELIHSL